jgi:hypothetical protein
MNMGQIHTFPTFAPARASRIAAALLNKHSPHEISEAIELLIDVLDLIGPPDEDAGDLAAVADGLPGDVADTEPDCDAKGDQAWVEWHTMHGNRKKRGQNLLASQEDDEEDDAPEQDDESGQCDEDGINCSAGSTYDQGPGCILSDPDAQEIIEGVGGEYGPAVPILQRERNDN